MTRVALAAILAVAAVGEAQTRAPRESVMAQLGTKKVTVEYGRPALGGRDMGALLSQLPPDRIWRAGVDQATTLTTDTDLMIGGKRVKAGKYTVYVHAPETGDYSLVLNTDPGVPLKSIFPAAPPELADALWPRLGDYEKVVAKEVLRVPLKRSVAAEKMDRFLIGLSPAKGGVSSITLTWGGWAYTTEIKAAS